MNEHDLDLALGAIGARRSRVSAPPTLRTWVQAMPVETPRPRFLLPHIDTGGFSMSTALKFVAAAAIVALFGGFLLSSALTTQQEGESLPAAVTESSSPVSGEATAFEGWLSQKLTDTVSLQSGTIERIPEEGRTLMMRYVGVGTEQALVDVSDPRLAGTLRTATNLDYFMEGPTSRVWTAAVRLDNADGSWLGHLTGYHISGQRREDWQQGILTGTGAYEGLTAIVFFDHPRTGDSRVHGVIFPGDMPEAPDYLEPAE